MSGHDSQAFLLKLFVFCFFIPTGLSNIEYQQQGKATCVSINWTLGDAQPEVVNTATGRRRDSGTPSRICKHALFTRWNRLYRKVRAHLQDGRPALDSPF